MRTAGEEIFANNIQMLQLELSAWIAHASGRQQEGVDLLRQAAALESSTPKHAVTPGPTLPAEELLGDMLMEQGRPADALAAYQRALNLYPRRFNSQSGVTRAARVSGDTQEKE
jgi:tetratricopeptide (TPR) repeat protein